MTDDLSFIRALMTNKTDAEIEERLTRLKRIGRGPGNKMHDDLSRLLVERRVKK